MLRKYVLHLTALTALLLLPTFALADTSSTQATISATVGSSTPPSPSTSTPPEEGGGGFTFPPSPPPDTPPEPEPEPEEVVLRDFDLCQFECSNDNFEVYMVNPISERYGMYSDHAEIYSLGGGVRNVFFEDDDPVFGPYQDVRLSVDSSCVDGGIYISLLSALPGPFLVGFLFESDDNSVRHDITLWEDAANPEDTYVRVAGSATACPINDEGNIENPPEPTPPPEEEIEIEAPEPPEETVSPREDEVPVFSSERETSPQCEYACLDDTYDLYIVTPDGTERHMGSAFVLVEPISEHVNRIYFEDSLGIDRDFNDVVFDVSQYCDRNLLTVEFVSKASTWAHQVWMRVTRGGEEISNVKLWSDSSQAEGEVGIVGGGQAAYCPDKQDSVRLRQPLLFEPDVRIASGEVPANFTANIFSTVVNDLVNISVPEVDLSGRNVTNVHVRVGNRKRDLRYNPQTQSYETSFPVDRLGDELIIVTVEHDGLVDTYPLTMLGVSPGLVVSRTDGSPIANARVELLDAFDGLPWGADAYGQQNPIQTDENGFYQFVVPAGEYVLEISANEYETIRTNPFRVQNVVNQTIELASATQTASGIAAATRAAENALRDALQSLGLDTEEGAIAAATERVNKAVEDFNEWADSPEVEKAVDTYVAPATVLIPAATVGPALASTAVPAVQYAFQYIFLQPLLLLGKKKKRKKWGTVYNSLTKRPLDLAIVRLVDAATGKVVQSRVTDGKGRFFFFADPGTYKLDVRKPTFIYPTTLLANQQSDGALLDVYHGEEIQVDEQGSEVAPNVPLDPPDADSKSVKRVRAQSIWHTLQQAISLSSIALAGVTYYIAPSPKVLIILCIHIFMYVAFMLYLVPNKPKGWGVVYNANTKKPISKAIARLFSVQYNKLIDTQITDRKGRYAFLVGPSVYKVVVEHDKYERTETHPISLENAKDEELLIKQKIPLTKRKKA